MKQYKITNNIIGWIVFAIAAFTYCMTVEPSASFWDCPEFISTATKLEVGHPPGAPFFMLTGNFFTHFTGDPAKAAFCVNIMSALLSALCILFLFWTITHLTRMLICKDGTVTTWGQIITIMGSGVVGALAYTWSDTFWFSAEEGEVYAYSSMFTALVFWLILKWEDHADEPHSDRWIVLIFYLTGLSIGVHLLNLLCLPAIALVYYYKRHPQAQSKGSLVALLVGFLLVAAVLYGVVPGIVKVGGWFELFFVNTLGMPFNTGMIVYILALIAVVLTAIWSTTKTNRTLTNGLYLASVGMLGIPFFGTGFMSVLIGIVLLATLYFLLNMKRKDGKMLLRKRILNTSLLCMLMLMIGYSSYAVIVIRSVANPPMDQNSPEDIFSLGSYLSRDQYEQAPLFFGQAFTSQPDFDASGHAIYNTTTEHHRKEKTQADEADTYEDVESLESLQYPSGMKMLFPRMYSSAHAQAYNDWLGGNIQLRDVNYTTSGGDFQYGQMPSQWDNLNFFMSYQVNFMYWRYFMWNFAGRQNGYQSNGEKEHGNWLTGIPFIDNAMYGNQKELPNELQQDKAHNVFYMLPLLLGLLGLFWQAFRGDKGVKQFWVVFFLFFMTGLAIVLYLNQTPMQPRERDYAYAGSFYAFAIWIGMGVAALADLLGRALKARKKATEEFGVLPAAVASVLCVLVPLQMVSQTWDDHDRSGRYACRDFGLNYLDTMPEKLADGTPANPIIFSNGDNDTFPLWYNQETEGKRTDARVCNLEYLQTEWYTDQMVRPAYNSPSLPIAWKRAEYVDDGKHGYFPIVDRKAELDAFKKAHPNGPDPYELTYIMDNYVRTKQIFPTDSVVVKVNKQNVINQGITVPAGMEIPDHISLSLKWAGRGMSRKQVMIYEMLARNNWKRPIYMSVTLGAENYAGLQDYFCLEGLAYRLTPFKLGQSRIDTDKMYTNLMTRFKYGNVAMPGIFLDETNLRMAQTHRRMFSILIERLLNEGKKDKALAALRMCEKVLPEATVPYEYADVDLAMLWFRAGDKGKAAKVAKEVARQNWQYLNWANTLPQETAYAYANSCTKTFLYLYRCVALLQDMKDKDFSLWNNRVNALSRTTAGSIGSQGVMKMMQQQQAPQSDANADENNYNLAD
jgi:putative membrane protein